MNTPRRLALLTSLLLPSQVLAQEKEMALTCSLAVRFLENVDEGVRDYVISEGYEAAFPGLTEQLSFDDEFVPSISCQGLVSKGPWLKNGLRIDYSTAHLYGKPHGKITQPVQSNIGIGPRDAGKVKTNWAVTIDNYWAVGPTVAHETFERTGRFTTTKLGMELGTGLSYAGFHVDLSYSFIPNEEMRMLIQDLDQEDLEEATGALLNDEYLIRARGIGTYVNPSIYLEVGRLERGIGAYALRLGAGYQKEVIHFRIRTDSREVDGEITKASLDLSGFAPEAGFTLTF